MRTFFALDLPDYFKNELSQVIDEAKKIIGNNVKWVKKDNLHITLQFLGKTSDKYLDDFTELTDKCSKKYSPIEFSHPEIKFIPAKRPKIIWVELSTADQSVFSLVKDIQKELSKRNFKIDTRKFRIHITLGRIKKTIPKFLFQKLKKIDIDRKTITVSKITFYQSILEKTGPIYRPIRTSELKKE